MQSQSADDFSPSAYIILKFQIASHDFCLLIYIEQKFKTNFIYVYVCKSSCTPYICNNGNQVIKYLKVIEVEDI